MNPGWVYILTNESLQSNYLKIGYTTNEPSVRASEISSATGVATPFRVAYSETVHDCVRAERLVHQKLEKYRVNNNREFFQVDLWTAKEEVHQSCESIRRDSNFCRQCEAYGATREIADMRKELSQHKRKIRRLKKYISFCRFCQNYISRLFSVIESIFRKIVPDRFDRKVYFWGLFVPLCFVGWIIIVGIFHSFGELLTLTLVLISALMVIGSVHQSECRDWDEEDDYEKR